MRMFTSEGMLNAFVNSLIVTIPATVIPITMAAFAAYAFAWMKFLVAVLFVVVVSLLVVPLQMTLVPLLRGYVQFWSDRDVSWDLASAYRFRSTARSVFAVQLYLTASQGPVRVGVYRRRLAFHSLHSAGAPAVGAGIGVVRHFPVSLGVERPPGGARLSWCPPGGIHTHHSAQRTGRFAGQDWHVLTAGAFVTMVVPLIVFLLLQRFFVRGSSPVRSRADMSAERALMAAFEGIEIPPWLARVLPDRPGVTLFGNSNVGR